MSFWSRFQRKQKNSGAKINFIDVGSAGRLPEPWDGNADCIDVLLKFEPRDDKGQKDSVISIDCALWEEPGTRDFYIYKGFNGTGSSLFMQNYRFVRENYDQIKDRGPKSLAETWMDRSQLVSVEQIACRTLDDVLTELRPRRVFEFLKIDAQGAEYQILQGARNYLSSDCQAMVLELFDIPLYEEIKLREDVVGMLDGFGFELVKKMPAHGTFDSQNDCLFVRRDAEARVRDLITQVYEL